MLGFMKNEKRTGLLTALALALGIGAGLGASGCVVRERVVARPSSAPCRGGVLVEGHYGPRGRWHPAHWRCPDVVERVEID